ncbi:MAG: PAS domain S-box protein, partial [Desulfosarcinaceae bacterium]
LKDRVESLSRQSQKLLDAESAIQRQNEHLHALHETAMGLLDKLERQELLQTILERAMGLANTRHGYIYLHDPVENCMEMRVGMGFFSNHLGLRVKPGQGLGGVVWQTGQARLVRDYQNFPERIVGPDMDVLRCVVGIPLTLEDTVRGVIGLAHVEEGRQFNQEDVQTLERFAALALLAMEKAELYSEARRELAERRKVESKIRESERMYRGFMDSSPDPIVVYDMNGEATYVNPAFEQTFGMSREETVGRRIDFVPPEAWPATQAAIQVMLGGTKIQLFETQRLTKDGRKLEVQISSCLLKDEKGEPAGNIVVLRDISALKRAEHALRNYQDQLEDLVEERTSELAQANTRLAREVDERKRAEKALIKREKDLQAQSQHLEEVNTALRVLLKQRDADKSELQANVLSNVKELVAPYLEQLKHSRLSTRQETLVRILESNLGNIVSPFIGRLSSRYVKFTPMEIRVANLVREGKTNKEIANLLLIAKNTVLFHRHNIRKKLNLTQKAINLRSHLLSFDE